MLKLKIEDFGFDGEGVVHINGKVGFIKYVLPGEEILAEVVKENSRFSVLEVKQILEQNENREKPLCPYFGKCCGCDFQHMKYEKELEIKKEILSRQLAKVGLKTNIVCYLGDEYFYRNRIRLFPSKDGLGYHTINDTIPIETCKIARPIIDKNIKFVSDFAKPYLNLLNYVELRTDDKKILINFFVKEKINADFENLAKKMTCNCGIYQTINKKIIHCYGDHF